VGNASLLVGIGSPHGDDAVGWLVAREVAARLGNRGDDFVARCARTPSELLNWLEGIGTLDICDAVVGIPPAQQIHCWPWPAEEIAINAFRGSHGLSLSAVLLLAERLGRLPRCVRIWGVATDPGESFTPISPAAASAAQAAVDQICRVLGHA
jgi:hydrogenase maturation protease